MAPSSELLKDYKDGLVNEEQYIKIYMNVLNKLSPQQTYDDIVNTYGDNVALLCYEKPPQFCHREIAAIWFENNLKITIKELPFSN